MKRQNNWKITPKDNKNEFKMIPNSILRILPKVVLPMEVTSMRKRITEKNQFPKNQLISFFMED